MRNEYSFRMDRKASPDRSPAAPRLFSRREVIQTGIAGIGLLALGAGCSPGAPVPSWPEMRFLPVHGQKILYGVYNGFAHAFLPEAAEDRQAVLLRMVQSTDAYLHAQPEHIQGELLEAFDFLSVAPVRWLLAGFFSEWEEADPEDIVEFLDSWLTSRLTLFRSIATFLQSMSSMAFFDQSESWGIVGYTDPSWVANVKWR